MALRYNIFATAPNAGKPTVANKSVSPVQTGGIHPSQVINGQYSIADRVAQSRQRIANLPNANRFTLANGGVPVTGWSGIVPFYRFPTGEVRAPVPTRRGIAKFFGKGA